MAALADGRFQIFTEFDQRRKKHDQEKSADNELMTFAIPAPGKIAGRVVVAGQPVADARVHFQWEASGGSWSHLYIPVGGQLSGNSDGTFETPPLAPGRYRVSRIANFSFAGGVSTSRYLSTEVVEVEPEKTTTLNFTQPAGKTMKGSVTFEGQPAAETIVSLHPTNSTNSTGSTRAQVIAAAQCDENGTFAIPHLPDGTYVINSKRYRLIDGSFRSQSSTPITVEFPSQEENIVIKLNK